MKVPRNKRLTVNWYRLPAGLLLLGLGLVVACTSSINKTAVPTATPSMETESATEVESQSQQLMLKLYSPPINMLTDLKQVNVAGVTSPDATLSVNGRLVSPDPQGY